MSGYRMTVCHGCGCDVTGSGYFLRMCDCGRWVCDNCVGRCWDCKKPICRGCWVYYNHYYCQKHG